MCEKGSCWRISRELGSSRGRANALEALLLHHLQRRESVATDGLDPLGVKLGLEVAEVLVLESDVALFREEYAREVHLIQGQPEGRYEDRSAPSRT